MGTRRLEEILKDARAQAYSEDYSLTEGWNDNVVARICNLGLDRLYHAITQIDNPAHIEQYSTDSVANQQAYDIPQDVFMAIRIMDVRYQWGNASYEFNTLKQSMIQDRYSFPINIPDVYCIRDGQILLSPTPSQSRTNAIIVNYQKRMRSVDVRRGRILSKTDSPVSITLTFTDEVAGYSIGTGTDTYTGNLPGAPITPSSITLTDGTLTVTDDGSGNLVGNIGAGTNTINYTTGAYDVTFSGATSAVTASYTSVGSSKNSKMLENSGELDQVDFISIVDKDGEPVASNVEVSSYDPDTKTIYGEAGYSFSATELTAIDAAIAAGDQLYVVQGKYSSSHSELDTQCESYLIEFIIARLLRLQSNTAEMTDAKIREEQAMSDLVNAYRRYRESVYPVRWTHNFRRSAYPFGRRGIYG